MIKKIKRKGVIYYQVQSHTSGRIMGTYRSKGKALQRYRQIKMFGEMKKAGILGKPKRKKVSRRRK